MARILVLVACIVFVISLLDIAHGQLNWGRKVSCYETYGTVICPGCNSRAGLSCPRRPKDKPEFRSCAQRLPVELSTEYDFPTELSTRYDTPTGFSTGRDFTSRATQENTGLTSKSTIFSTPNSWKQQSTVYGSHLPIFLYRYFARGSTGVPRRVTENFEVDTREICQGNQDCPCPLICCKQGEGCPKRCVLGIRLPPPFGG